MVTMPRVMGSESELATYVSKKNSENLDRFDASLQQPRTKEIIQMVRNSRFSALPGNIYMEFLSNQGRLYWDCNRVEISTPETTNTIDLLIYEKAMERIVDYIRMMYQKFSKERGTTEKVFVLKDSCTFDHKSAGYHENYMMERKAFQRMNTEGYRNLIPHLVTRSIYTGAGDIRLEKDMEDKVVDFRDFYIIWPRAQFFKSDASKDATELDRAIYNKRDESHSKEHSRLHVVAGDGNMSETSIALKHGPTSMILRLFEDGKQPDLDFHEGIDMCGVVRGYGVMRAMELSNGYFKNPDMRLLIRSSGTDAQMSPVEIQWAYLDPIEDGYVLDDVDQMMLDMWKVVLKDLEYKRVGGIARKLDCWIKPKYLDEMARDWEKEHGRMPTLKELFAISKSYHEIDNMRDGEGRSGYYRMQNEGKIDRLVTDAQIMRALETPPSDTRARLRSNIMRTHKENVSKMDWGMAVVNYRGTPMKITFDLFDTDITKAEITTDFNTEEA